MYGDDEMEENPFLDDDYFDQDGLLEDFDEEGRKIWLYLSKLFHLYYIYINLHSMDLFSYPVEQVRSN